MPHAERPYRVWFYPLTPVLYLLAAALVVGSMILASFAEDAPLQERYQIPAVAGLIVVGLFLYAFFRRLEQTTPAEGS
jgi:hypothetical protein